MVISNFRMVLMTDSPDERLVDVIAHCLLWGTHAYPTPDAFARAMLKRLEYEGYKIIMKEGATP